MIEEKQVISYHTFIFPFLFDTTGKCRRQNFLKCLPEQGKALIRDAVDWDAVPDKSLFAQYRYFTQAAKNAIYTTGYTEDAIVWNYRYDLPYMVTGQSDHLWYNGKKDSNNPFQLLIRHGSFNAKLSIHGVRLKLYNTGIGLLCFELENYELSQPDEIISINEFGRRVFMPYIDEDRVCDICADQLSLLYNGKEIPAASGQICKMDSSRADRIELAPFITYFLSNQNRTVTASPNPRKNEYFIEPIIDDRMFVACLYANDRFVNNMSQWNYTQKAYAFLVDAENMVPSAKSNTAAQLYKMMFIDGGILTCNSRPMLKQMLQMHIYDRWLEEGTITGITEYSMISVTTRKGFCFLPDSFLTEYVEMIYLVLAQRATFLAFERTVSNVACAGYKYNIDVVQHRYVMFQSQLLPQAITTQQQGLELYEMLQNCLLIEQQHAEIEAQISALFELNSGTNEKLENIILFVLATLGVVDCVDVFFGSWFPLQGWTLPCIAVGIISLLVIYNFFGKKIRYLFRKFRFWKK